MQNIIKKRQQTILNILHIAYMVGKAAFFVFTAYLVVFGGLMITERIMDLGVESNWPTWEMSRAGVFCIFVMVVALCWAGYLCYKSYKVWVSGK